MQNWILMVSNNLDNFEATKEEWLKYHVFAKSPFHIQICYASFSLKECFRKSHIPAYS